MPVFKYLVINDSHIPEFIEVEQTLDEAALAIHPLTGEPIQRVPTKPSLSLNHSTAIENKILSPDNLEKNGFSILERNDSNHWYTQTCGKNPNLNKLSE
jgi:hypothetical protein